MKLRDTEPLEFILNKTIAENSDHELSVNVLGGFLEIIKDLPVVEPKQEWISVKDDMPKERESIFARFYGTDKWKTGMYRTVSEDVIACLEAKNGHRMVKVLSTQDGDWKVNVIYQAEVTHWMPLPEPPRGGK